jgi:L-threonylcarbamoyladenylate synthase
LTGDPVETKILVIDKQRPDARKIRIAAEAIKNGGLVIFPTETVYGIGADAFNFKASKRIYKVKGRPSDNPLMIHVSSIEMASRIGYFPEKYKKIVKKLWPGPISFVVKAMPGLRREEVSIRMPAHKVALALIKKSDTPIAAPSANISKKPSSTKAKHAIDYFNGKVDVIIDSGPSGKGIESTILNLRNFTLQRPGSYPIEKITEAFGRTPRITGITRGLRDASKATVPGVKYRHYSPDMALYLYTGNPEKLPKITRGLKRFAFVGSTETCNRLEKNAKTVIRLGSRTDIDRIARHLFDGLIQLDSLDVDFAITESFGEKGVGLGVMNRLRKASAHRYFSTRKELLRFINR